MDPRTASFLQSVVGRDGAAALVKAAQDPDLAWALVPRAVMAWLDVVGRAAQYDAGLPGAEDVRLLLRKSELGYCGYVTIGGRPYPFQDVQLEHVAGGISIALGLEPGHHPLHHRALPALGKSIDLLVKSRAVRALAAAAAKRPPKPNGAPEAPGPAAAPTPAQEPTGPTAVQPPNTGAQAQNGAADAPAKPPAKSRPKRPQLRVTKAEAQQSCPTCGGHQFEAGRYVGCGCWADLAKSVKTTRTAAGFVLEFGPAWDAEAVLALAEGFGR